MSIYKRIGSLILSLLLVFSMFGSTFAVQTFAATTTVLSTESKSVSAGEQFTVAVNLSNATSVYDGNFTLQYDSSLLTADSYSFGSIVNEHNKSCNLDYQSAGNLIRMTFYGTSSISANGTLVTITFTAKEDVSGTAALQFTNYKMYDLNGSLVTTTANGSNITIASEPVISPTISVANKTVTVGDTFSIPVLINDSESVYDGNFTLQYDSDLLTVNSYSYGSVVDSHNKNCNLDYQSAGNLIRFTFNGTSALSSGGTLVTFNFTAKSEGTAALKFTEYKMYDKNGSSISTTISNGSIKIEPKPDAPSVQKILVYSGPEKSLYSIGEPFDPTGLWINVTYNDGTTAIVKTGFNVSGYDSQKEGKQTLTVSFGGKTATFNVRVDADGIFTITFDANGGSGAPNPITYTESDYFQVPRKTPTRDGYVFSGWADSPTSTYVHLTPGNSVNLSAAYYGDFTVYAIWIDNVISGQCGDNAYYDLTLDTGELVISGTGAVWDYTVNNYKERPWNDYTDQIKKVSVESGITKVGDFAFAICDEITDVVLSNTVESVGKYAFYSISELSNVQLGGALTLGEGAFGSCDNLTSIDLNNVVTIGKHTFYMSHNLDNVVIPESVKEVGEAAFGFCDKLSKITILADGATFGYCVFNECDSLTEVHISDLAAWCNISFDTSAVDSNPLYIAKKLYIGGILETDITIPESVTSINHTFYGCTSIERVTILNKKTTFDYDAFEKHVTILGYTGSKAEYYANMYGLEFIALDEITIQNVSINNKPTKTTYYIGDSLSTSGLKLLITYSDGTTKTITSGFTISGFSSTSAGTKTITVSYEGFTDTFTVTVKTPSITLSSSSKTMSIGDTSTTTATTTPSAQTVTWTSSNTSVATVSGGKITAKASGSTTITAKFTYNGKTYSKTCSVTVEDVPVPPTPESLSVSTKPTKTTYEIGESLNTSGLKLKLTYSDGSTETITSGFTTSGFSSTTAGTKTVTVKYSGLSTTFTVTVTHTHDYTSSITKKPSCTSTGVRTYTCSSCGDSYTEIISATGHDWDRATCEEPKTCTKCGITSGDALGHDYNARTTKNPTCTESGIKTYTCMECGDVYTKNISALGHDYDSGKVTKKASCKATGIKTYTCEDCGATKTSTIAKVTTHTYSNNCDKTCNVCGKTRTVGAHKYSNSCDTTCNYCNAKRSIKHIYSNNCDASCNVCKATRSITHSYKTTTTKATLTKNGSVVKKCTVCGKVASNTAIKYVKSFKLSTTTYTYNGKVKTPTVTVKDSAGKTLKKNTDYTVTYASGRKNAGTYKVTIKMIGKYSGTKTLTFKINPAKTTVSKLTAGKKSITVAITKKSTQVTGYQIQYSTSKTFSKATTKTISSYKTTKYTLKSLSAKKTYYVRVRTYKTVGKTKYYSGWSTYKYVKTK